MMKCGMNRKIMNLSLNLLGVFMINSAALATESCGLEYIMLKVSTNSLYLVKLGESPGYMLIDAGKEGRIGEFRKQLKKAGIQPAEIKVILLTHAHFDHFGGLHDILELCGHPPVVIHENGAQLVRDGEVVIPSGTTAFTNTMHTLGTKVLGGKQKLDGVEPDLTITAPELSLKDLGEQLGMNLGLEGRILFTPGHTYDSISILFDSGDAFVGDLIQNALPFNMGPIFPPFADDVKLLLLNWDRLLFELNYQTFHPGHGEAVGRDELIAKYHEMMKKYSDIMGPAQKIVHK